MEKIILYYKFVPVPDPESVKFWQKNLCQRLNLKGRIIVSETGINGTVGGDMVDVKEYVKEMNLHPLFKKISYKWSEGKKYDFPRLSVKVRKELVTLAPDEEFDVFNSTKGLSPKQWHEYIENNPDVLILDARNDYESDIGAFKGKNVVKPKIGSFREIKETLKELPKDKPVLTYCTGDIRCEYLSAYMNHKGFDEVYHLDGGIVKYGQQYGDKGHWEGKCFVFDDRMNIGFSHESKDIGSCTNCKKDTSRHINCANKQCNKLILMCDDCNKMTVCSEKCRQVLTKIKASI